MKTESYKLGFNNAGCGKDMAEMIIMLEHANANEFWNGYLDGMRKLAQVF